MQTDSEVSAVKTTSTLNLLAGLWLFVSPWVYVVYMAPNAWNNWIVGALIVIFGAIRFSNPMTARGASIVNLILGAWTFASPWIYGYTTYQGRLINSLCVGFIVFVLGVYGSSHGVSHTTTTPAHT
jgi:SPW repeat-containing protein